MSPRLTTHTNCPRNIERTQNIRGDEVEYRTFSSPLENSSCATNLSLTPCSSTSCSLSHLPFRLSYPVRPTILGAAGTVTTILPVWDSLLLIALNHSLGSDIGRNFGRLKLERIDFRLSSTDSRQNQQIIVSKCLKSENEVKRCELLWEMWSTWQEDARGYFRTSVQRISGSPLNLLTLTYCQFPAIQHCRSEYASQTPAIVEPTGTN